MKITFLNNDGGTGLSEPADVTEGTTIGNFLSEKGINTERHKIRVRTRNEGGEPTVLTPSRDYVLKDGDFVSAVPAKAEGGA